MSRRYKRIVGGSDEVLDAIEDYIDRIRNNREIPENLSAFLREQRLLQSCDFDACADCEMFLFRTGGTIRDANDTTIAEKEVWHCDCGRRHIHYPPNDTWVA